MESKSLPAISFLQGEVQQLQEAKGDPESVFLQALLTELKAFSFPIDKKMPGTKATAKGALVLDISRMEEEGFSSYKAIAIPLMFKGKVTTDATSPAALTSEKDVLYYLLGNRNLRIEVEKQLWQLPSIKKLNRLGKSAGGMYLERGGKEGIYHIFNLVVCYNPKEITHSFLTESDATDSTLTDSTLTDSTLTDSTLIDTIPALQEARGGVVEAWRVYLEGGLRDLRFPVHFSDEKLGSLVGKMEFSSIELDRNGRFSAFIVQFPFSGKFFDAQGKEVDPKNYYSNNALNDLLGAFCRNGGELYEKVFTVPEVQQYFKQGRNADLLKLSSVLILAPSFEVLKKENKILIEDVELGGAGCLANLEKNNIYPPTVKNESLSYILQEAKGGVVEAWLAELRKDARIAQWEETLVVDGVQTISGEMAKLFTKVRVKEIVYVPLSGMRADLIAFILEFSNSTLTSYQSLSNSTTRPIPEQEVIRILYGQRHGNFARAKFARSLDGLPIVAKLLEATGFMKSLPHYVDNITSRGEMQVYLYANVEYIIQKNTYPPNMSESLSYILQEAKGGVGEAWAAAIREAVKDITYPLNGKITIQNPPFSQFRVEGVISPRLENIEVRHQSGLFIPFQWEGKIEEGFDDEDSIQYIYEQVRSELERVVLAGIQKKFPRYFGYLHVYSQLNKKVGGKWVCEVVILIGEKIKSNVYPPSSVDENSILEDTSATPLSEARGGVAAAWVQYIKSQIKDVTQYISYSDIVGRARGLLRLDMSTARINNTYPYILGEGTFLLIDIVLDGKVDAVINADKFLRRMGINAESSKFISNVNQKLSLLGKLRRKVKGKNGIADFAPIANWHDFLLSGESVAKKNPVAALMIDLTGLVNGNVYPNDVSEATLPALQYLKSLPEARGGIEEAWRLAIIEAIKDIKIVVDDKHLGMALQAQEYAAKGNIVPDIQQSRVINHDVVIPLHFEGEFTPPLSNPAHIVVLYNEVYRKRIEDACWKAINKTISEYWIGKVDVYTSLKRKTTGEGRELYLIVSLEVALNNNHYPKMKNEALSLSTLSEARGGAVEAWVNYLNNDARIKTWKYTFRKQTVFKKGTREPYTAEGILKIKKVTFDAGESTSRKPSINFLFTFPEFRVLNWDTGEAVDITSDREEWIEQFIRGQVGSGKALYTASQRFYKIPAVTAVMGATGEDAYGKYLLATWEYFDGKTFEGAFTVIIEDDFLEKNLYPPSVSESVGISLPEAKGGVFQAWVDFILRDTKVRSWGKTFKDIPIYNYYKDKYYNMSGKVRVKDIQYDEEMHDILCEWEFYDFVVTETGASRTPVDITNDEESWLTVFKDYLWHSGKYSKMFLKYFLKLSTIKTVYTALENADIDYFRGDYKQRDTYGMLLRLRSLIHDNIYPPAVNEDATLPLQEARGGVEEAWISAFREELRDVKYPVKKEILMTKKNVIRAEGNLVLKVESIVIKNNIIRIPIGFVGKIDPSNKNLLYYILSEVRKDIDFRSFLQDRSLLQQTRMKDVWVSWNLEKDGYILHVDLDYELKNNIFPKLEQHEDAILPLQEARGGEEAYFTQGILQELKSFSIPVKKSFKPYPYSQIFFEVEGEIRADVSRERILPSIFNRVENITYYIPLVFQGTIEGNSTDHSDYELITLFLYPYYENQINGAFKNISSVKKMIKRMTENRVFLPHARFCTVSAGAWESMEGYRENDCGALSFYYFREELQPAPLEESLEYQEEEEYSPIVLDEAKGGVEAAWITAITKAYRDFSASFSHSYTDFMTGTAISADIKLVFDTVVVDDAKNCRVIFRNAENLSLPATHKKPFLHSLVRRIAVDKNLKGRLRKITEKYFPDSYSSMGALLDRNKELQMVYNLDTSESIKNNEYPPTLSESCKGGGVVLDEARGGISEAWKKAIRDEVKNWHSAPLSVKVHEYEAKGELVVDSVEVWGGTSRQFSVGEIYLSFVGDIKVKSLPLEMVKYLLLQDITRKFTEDIKAVGKLPLLRSILKAGGEQIMEIQQWVVRHDNPVIRVSFNMTYLLKNNIYPEMITESFGGDEEEDVVIGEETL